MNSILLVCVVLAGVILAAVPSDQATRHWNSQHNNHQNWGWGNGNDNDSSGEGGRRDRFTEERNKRVVLGFYQEVLGDHNIEAADKYISSKTYIQHNPTVGDGLEAMKVAMRGWFAGVPPEKIDVQHISAEGDLVWIHIRSVDFNTKKVSSIMDIFKLKNGKIIEHWDVAQEVPEKSANSHPMF